MKRAICLPYSTYQNEPSVPIKRIIEIPDDVAVRDKLLADLFTEYVCGGDVHPVTIKEGGRGCYGDLIVSSGDDDVFMFVTYIEEI